MKLSMDTSILTVQKNLSKSNKSISTLIERLSTGSKINKAADDAANLSVSKQMESQSSGLKVANDNISQGNDLIETADGALSNIETQLQKMRDLAVQAANDSYSVEEKKIIQQETTEIKSEIDNIIETTTYNDIKLFNDDVYSGAGIGEGETVGIEAGQGFQQITPKTVEELDSEYGEGNWVGIASRAELEAIETGSASAGKTYVLTGDIDLSDGDWSSLGAYVSKTDFSQGFQGTLDGNGHTISNLTINQTSQTGVGLFAATYNATIKNISLTNVDINGQKNTGAITGIDSNSELSNISVQGSFYATGQSVGGLVGLAQSNSIITNCSSQCDVKSDNGCVGGLVGYLNDNSSITNSYSTSNVYGKGNWVGGLVGYGSKSIITNSYSKGDVKSDNIYVGGLVGMTSSLSITNSYSTSNVYGKGGYAGGLVGSAQANSTITNCYAKGDVKSDSYCVGGLVGSATSSITNSYSTSNVYGKGEEVGGLVGEAKGNSTITNCYSKGNVKSDSKLVGGLVGMLSSSSSITNSYSTSNVYGKGYKVGGLVGHAQNSSTITNCYSKGDVKSDSGYVGGLVGMLYDNSTIINSYSTSNVYGKEDNIGGLVGYMNNSTLSNSYSIGSVTGKQDSGGIVGWTSGTNSITNCYTTSTVNRLSDSSKTTFGSFYGHISDATTITNSYSLNQDLGFTGTTQNNVEEKELGWFQQTTNWSDLGSGFDYSTYPPQITGNLEPKTKDILLQIGSNSGMDDMLNFNTGLLLTTININLSNSTNANQSITEIDNMLAQVSKKRSELGVVENKLQSIFYANTTKKENLDASLSTIRDTDIAKATSELTKHQILQQSSASLLSQCGDINSTNALSLLNGSKLY